MVNYTEEMKIAIIGRSELMFDTMLLCRKNNWEIALVVTAKEAPEYKKTAKDFEALAIEIGAEYLYTPKLKSQELKELKSIKSGIDICLSVNYSGVIPDDVIALFRLGILNAHGGDLPKYRGNACQAWAIINGEKKIGLCIHKMIGGELDSGDIILREYYNVDLDTRIGEIMEWMTISIPKMFLEATEKLFHWPDYVLEKQSRNPEDALRCYPRNPTDGKVNWRMSNEEIVRLVNASSEPFAGAFGILDDKIFTIWRAEVYNDTENYLAVPGQVAAIKDDGCIIVITGKGKIKVSLITYDGITCKPAEVIKSIRKRLL